MILTSSTVGYSVASSALYALSFIALIVSFRILRGWDFNSFSNAQYKNEKNAYLVSTLIYFLLFFKILLSIYLLYLIDSLTPFIKAAMCGVGVLNSTVLGWELLVLKIVLLISFGLWIVSDKIDRERLNYPFLKFKFRFFILIFLLMSVEYAFELAMIFNLDAQKVVSCCSVTFSNKAQVGELFSLSIPNITKLFTFFLLFFLLTSILTLRDSRFSKTLFLSSPALLFASLFFIIYAVSPYVYELPTHTCPFCLIQKEYSYIGYILYLSVILGAFYAIKSAFTQYFFDHFEKKDIYKALLLNALFLLLVIYYILGYYLKNGVWL